MTMFDTLFSCSQVTDQLAPDWQWNAVLLQEDTSYGYHFALTNIAKATSSLEYAFYGDFKYAGRDLAFGAGSNDAVDGVQIDIDMRTGLPTASPYPYGSTASLWTMRDLTISPRSNGYFNICAIIHTDTTGYVAPFIQAVNRANGANGTMPSLGDGFSGVLFANVHFHKLNV